jgi:NAD(P)-dependent dehydrogenase (short-subunit alcohol dehydrogenase family)
MTGQAQFDFTGESAIVTGSTKGIGHGIATVLAESGANVGINARSADDVESVAQELDERHPGDVIALPADVGSPAAVETLVETAIDAFGTIDLLVNNAALWPREPSMLEASLEDWDQVIAVNVRSQFQAASLVAAHMRANDVEGNIINVTSQTGDRRTGGRGLYGISNTAVNGLTWRMAHEFAHYGIRVNAISTDVTETPTLRYEAGLAAADTPDRSTDDVLDEWGANRPLGRLGQPTDLGEAVLFLASEQASYIVGTILRVAGGGNLQGES